MPTNTLFVSEEYIRKNTVINENIDSKYLLPIMLRAQEKYMLRLLGTGLYNELQQQIANNNISPANLTLLNDYISICLSEYILYEAAPFLVYKYTNKTIAKKNSENSTPAELKEVIWLQEQHMNSAQWYAQRLIDYLCANSHLYPLYLNPGNSSDTIKPNNQSIYTMLFGKGKNYLN